MASRSGAKHESDTSVSELSDTPAACHSLDPAVQPIGADAAGVGATSAGSRSARLDSRYSVDERARLDAHAARLGVRPSALQRALVLDGLGSRGRHVERIEAAAALAAQQSEGQRELAAQIRTLAINVNDLDRRARSGEAVTLGGDVPELIELLTEYRVELLGDKVAGR